MKDWLAWHDRYREPASEQALRLPVVQGQIAAALDRQPAGPIRVVSLCAGDGRDLLGVLPGHPRRDDVSALLVELDPRLAPAGSPGVRVVVGDAALTSQYADAVPAGLVLLCGIFGNVSDADIKNTVFSMPGFCAPAATVIWTRHRDAPDLYPTICDWFASAGFAPVFTSAPDLPYGVGAHIYTGPAVPLTPGHRLFTFR